MDKTSVWCLALLGILYAWLGQYKAAAKCSGAWAIHACHGGNGKRSDPGSLLEDNTNRRRRIGLQQILAGDIRERQPWREEEALPQYDDMDLRSDDEEMARRDEMEQIRIQRGKELLNKLMLLLKLKSEMQR